MAPVRSYTNWNCRENDAKEQIEPYRTVSYTHLTLPTTSRV